MPRHRFVLGLVLVGCGIVVCFDRLPSGQGGAVNGFVRGDATADGEINLTDAVAMLWCHFAVTGCPTCADAADVNDDGLNDITDPIYCLNYLFLEGAQPPAPFEACGPDPTADDLVCESFVPCPPVDADTIPTANGDLVITPVEHASLVLRWNDVTIYADPVGGAAKFAGLPAPDIIFVTHTHSDHLNRATILAVAGEGTVLVVPQAVSQSLAGQGGTAGIEQKLLANGGNAAVAGIEIEAVPMYNARHVKGEGNGYVLSLGGARVYIAGDTEDIPEMRRLEAIDLAFIPMNLPFTMTVEQAASAVLEFKPRVVYPYHYRGQDTRRFKSLVDAESGEVEVRLREWYPTS